MLNIFDIQQVVTRITAVSRRTCNRWQAHRNKLHNLGSHLFQLADCEKHPLKFSPMKENMAAVGWEPSPLHYSHFCQSWPTVEGSAVNHILDHTSWLMFEKKPHKNIQTVKRRVRNWERRPRVPTARWEPARLDGLRGGQTLVLDGDKDVVKWRLTARVEGVVGGGVSREA